MTTSFRIWDRNSRRMITTEPRLAADCLVFTFNRLLPEHPSFDDIVILRNTDCHDKNGKEIYEEDYVRFEETGELGVVRYRNGMFVIDEAVPYEEMTMRPVWEHSHEIVVDGSSLQHPEWML